MANRTQIQTALQKPYDRLLFGKEVLNPVFGSCFTLNTSAVPASVQPNASEQAVIQSVSIYGNINLEDGTDVNCYEIILQPSVRIEHSKVAIQRYVRKLLTAGQIALVNFIAPQNKKVWRLTLVAKDSELTEQGIQEKTTHAKRYTYLLGPSETCKTAAERFEALSTEKQITFQALVNAFSVEKLSKAFFDEYTLHYQKFCDYLQESNFRKSVFKISLSNNATKEEKEKACKPIRDFVKKLLGRIVFLYFVQKKGWLGASDTNYKDGLNDFIKKLFAQSGGDDTFYPNWLTVLFFETLNKERSNDEFEMPDGKNVKVPFLNGGLFDKEDFDQAILPIPARLFHHPDFEDELLTEKNWNNARGFLDFLDAFNFTVHEDSPDDHTVAVDPEMLGHIFENLLEDNKDKGAFYTPKEIVHYMCQESLTEYLTTHLCKDYTVYKEIDNAQVELFGNDNKTGQLKMIEQLGDKALNRDDVAYIVKQKDISHLTKPQLKRIDDLLDMVKICDPAIGSGAFPMGLLQEIHAIKEVIAYELQQPWKPADVKENIIQNSVYGVDIEKGAVDIARLRFWLSLVVDEEKPRALPNLDYKIVVGDSLVSKFEDEIIEIDWEIKEGTQGNLFGNENVLKRQALLKKITAKQSEYFHTTNKQKLAAEIRILKIDILINQLELMINTKGLEKKPTESGKKAAAQMELWHQTQSWKNTISKLQRVKQNNEEPFEHFDWKLDFPEVLNPYLVNGNAGFDIVIGNPPYFQLREIEDTLQLQYEESKYFEYAKGGRLNVFQFFIPFSILNAKNDGIICLITQNSILGEETAYSNRKFIFDNTEIIRFDSFPERDNKKTRVFESVKMSVAISLLRRKQIKINNFDVWVWKDKFMSSKMELSTSKNEIAILYPSNLIIPITSQDALEILKSIKNHSNHYFLNSSAGEVDMTKFKNSFNIDKKGVRVYTGAQIQRFHTTDNPQQGNVVYLKESQLPKTGKFKNSMNERIAMQRITGVDSAIRLIMTIIPAGTLCANSLNFISNNDRKKLRYELGLLNSKLINAYFKFTSTNTNVTTTEINSIPIAKASDADLIIISKIVDYLLFLKRLELDFISDQLMPTYFEQIINGIVYELYFPELIKKHKREIIQHLGDLPEFTDKMSDEQKMKICKTVFNRLNEREHPVRVNLSHMNTIPEIAIIEGKNENK